MTRQAPMQNASGRASLPATILPIGAATLRPHRALAPRLPPLPLQPWMRLQKLRWLPLPAATLRSMNVGCLRNRSEFVGGDGRVGSSRFYMDWSQSHAIWEDSTEEKRFSPSHSWIEVVHCRRLGTGATRKSPKRPWFFLAPGSGVWFNVGETLQLHEDYQPVILRDLLGIKEWFTIASASYKTIQLRKPQDDPYRPIELVWLNTSWSEGNTMADMAAEHLMCGDNETALTSCVGSPLLAKMSACDTWSTGDSQRNQNLSSIPRDQCDGLPLYLGGFPRMQQRMQQCNLCSPNERARAGNVARPVDGKAEPADPTARGTPQLHV